MTFEDLKKIEQLEIVEYSGNSVHIHCERGYYITDFEGEDWINYNDWFCMYIPIKDEYPNYYVVDYNTHVANWQNRQIAVENKKKEELKKLLERNDD